MQIDFTNRNIIVLGGSDGIGLRVAMSLAKNNANVCIVGRNISKLEAAYASIKQSSTNNIYVNADLTKPESIDNIHNSIKTNWGGRVDSLVLNAGGPPFVQNAIDVPLSDWHTYFQSLFLSQIDLVSRCLESMKANQFGRIVSISSSSIVEPIPGLVVSSAIRSALASWLKTLSMEVAKDGINIMTAPIGKIATNRLKTLDAKKADMNSSTVDEVMINNYKNIPIGRYGTPTEAANIILFLLSEYSSYINGSSVFIDGGSIKKCF